MRLRDMFIASAAANVVFYSLEQDYKQSTRYT